MICRHCSRHPRPHPERLEYITSPQELPFGKWLIHQIAHLEFWLGLEIIWWTVIRFPVLDAENEGAELHWRWDFWNGELRKKYLELQRQGRIEGFPELGLKRLFARAWKSLQNRAQNALKILWAHGRGPRG